jgi:hypothetical protein
VQNDKVAPEFHLGLRIVRSERDIGDALVGGMAGIDGKVGAPPDLLVGSRLAERLVIKPWLTAEHLDAPKFSRGRKREKDRPATAIVARPVSTSLGLLQTRY